MSSAIHSHQPRVSIGLPVYNGERYLAAAIESVLTQTYADLELIICDNASSDGTEAICRAYAARDARVRYVRNAQNLGAAPNYNLAFKLARGVYFKWQAHDDICDPELIGACVEELERAPQAALCYARTTFIDEAGAQLRTIHDGFDLRDQDAAERFRRFLPLARGWMNPAFGLYRTAVLRETDLIGSYPSSDMILVADMVLRGPIHEIPRSLFFRREHPQMSVRANPSAAERQRWFNASYRGRAPLTHWRWVAEYMRIIWRAPLGLPTALRCSLHMVRWLKWTRRDLLRDLLVAAQSLRMSHSRG